MKFLERFTLVIYSLIILILSIILSLLIFNWMKYSTFTDMLKALITGAVSSKIALGICVVFILLSIKCIFFDEKSKEVIKDAQGIMLKNENGKLMISKETIENMVKNTVIGFENIKQCNTKIEVNEENLLKITLFLEGTEDVIIKELANNLQLKIKEEVKKISDLDVQEVNVKIMNLE